MRWTPPSRSRKKSISTKMPKSSSTVASPARNDWARWFACEVAVESTVEAVDMAVPPVARRTQAIRNG